MDNRLQARKLSYTVASDVSNSFFFFGYFIEVSKPSLELLVIHGPSVFISDSHGSLHCAVYKVHVHCIVLLKLLLRRSLQ